MLFDVNTNSHFSHEILRAFKAVDAGQAYAFVMKVTTGTNVVETMTVGGAWIGDVFSWRVAPGQHDAVYADMGEEIFGGLGDEDDATKAAMKLVEKFAGIKMLDWQIDA